jgi:1-acyl-sn-glycerol-3-phosphate acyltransferase
MHYTQAMSVLRAIIPIIARIHVDGAENLPTGTAPYLLVFNHIGRLDPPVVYYLLNRNDVIALVAEKYQRFFWSRWLVNSVDGIFVDRFNADLSALREVFRRVKKGGVVVLAPEGTRSPTGILDKAWDGASYIAARVGLPVVPVGLNGSGDRQAVERLMRFKRLDIEVRIGPPFSLPPLKHQSRNRQLATYTEEIMCRIASLLPESQRGRYATHPRLQELMRGHFHSQITPDLAPG